ncbi:CapA family protein [Flavobacteriaceae bacterium TP-CH-4]|uniref:CapA family protein n=2 Tax=Pelagihabitans pacificus TaxID=2696054 RepID=A0A967AY54_9FLAO|nr:CapA family protein [Pelagihabitans pacificus]
MTGRGVDQILPHPSHPMLYESYVKDARHYVELAEKVNGPIDRPVTYNYLWGDKLQQIREADARIINLETSITYSEHFADKGINYRMHPENIPCLTVAHIDCCVLANNHIMDWGQEGLLETLETLEEVGIACCGAGRDRKEAETPAVVQVGKKGRVLVFSFGTTSSGISHGWKATENRPGVNLLNDFSMETIKRISRLITKYKQPGDVAIASIHWGGNWGYDIPKAHRQFAHDLIDFARVDIVHGHSSHHFLGIEVYQRKAIIYGCGDLLNDYEGIAGHESYKAHLGFLYFVKVDALGQLVSLQMVPTEVKKFQITRPNKKNRARMQKVLSRECKQFGTTVEWADKDTLNLEWT